MAQNFYRTWNRIHEKRIGEFLLCMGASVGCLDFFRKRKRTLCQNVGLFNWRKDCWVDFGVFGNGWNGSRRWNVHNDSRNSSSSRQCNQPGYKIWEIKSCTLQFGPYPKRRVWHFSHLGCSNSSSIANGNLEETWFGISISDWRRAQGAVGSNFLHFACVALVSILQAKEWIVLGPSCNSVGCYKRIRTLGTKRKIFFCTSGRPLAC